MTHFMQSIADSFNSLIGKPPREMSEAEELFRGIGVPYKSYKDGTIFVPGNVSIGARRFYKEQKKLPDLSKVYIAGDFRCNNLDLENLKGSPAYVGGNFDCSGNKLKDLKDGPAYVGGNYDCAGNLYLATLENRPLRIGQDLMCMNTRIGDYRGKPSAEELLRSDEALLEAKNAYESIKETEAFKKVEKAERPFGYDDLRVEKGRAFPSKPGGDRPYTRGRSLVKGRQR